MIHRTSHRRKLIKSVRSAAACAGAMATSGRGPLLLWLLLLRASGAVRLHHVTELPPSPGFKPYMFLHMRKCGGTSFCKLVKLNSPLSRKQQRHNCNLVGLGPQTLTSCRDPDYLSCDQQSQELKWPIQLGASEIPIAQPYCFHHFRYVTTLREPLGRIASHIRYHHLAYSTVRHLLNVSLKGEPREPEGILVTVDKIPSMVQQLVNKKNGSNPHCAVKLLYWYAVFDNYFIRMLLGWSVYNLPRGDITRAHLEQAKALLLKYDKVFILEENEAYFRWMEQDLKWSNISSAHRERKPKSSVDKNIGDDELRIYLENLNKLDSELYEFARSLPTSRANNPQNHTES
eukprot:g66870.t1